MRRWSALSPAHPRSFQGFVSGGGERCGRAAVLYGRTRRLLQCPQGPLRVWLGCEHSACRESNPVPKPERLPTSLRLVERRRSRFQVQKTLKNLGVSHGSKQEDSVQAGERFAINYSSVALLLAHLLALALACPLLPKGVQRPGVVLFLPVRLRPLISLLARRTVVQVLAWVSISYRYVSCWIVLQCFWLLLSSSVGPPLASSVEDVAVPLTLVYVESGRHISGVPWSFVNVAVLSSVHCHYNDIFVQRELSSRHYLNYKS